MAILKTFALFLSAVTFVKAVTITGYINYNGDTDSCNDSNEVSLSCPNIESGMCCGGTTAGVAGLAAYWLFQGLPLPQGGFISQGTLYSTPAGCTGTVCASDTGLNLCQTCTPSSSSANWVRVAPSGETRQQSSGSVEPSEARFGGHVFHIFHNVPYNTSMAMIEFMRTANLINDDTIPEEFWAHQKD